MKGLLVCTQVGMQVVAPSKSLSTTNMVTMKGLLTRVGMLVFAQAGALTKSLSTANMVTMKRLLTRVGTLVTLQVTEIPESLVAGVANVPAMVQLVVFSGSRGGYLLLFGC